MNQLRISRRGTWRGIIGCAAVTAIIGASAVTAGPGADAATTDTVSATPAAWTPYLNSADSTIEQLVPTASTMYAVGTFSSIKDSSGRTFARNNVFAFSLTTGAVSPWVANANGTVYSAAVSADGQWVYLGGAFSSVNGVPANKLAKVSASTGAVDRTFNARAGAAVRALILRGAHLIVGGQFTSIGGVNRTAMASISPITGADDGYVNLSVSGTESSTADVTRVINFELSHGGTRLLAMGNFTSVAGQARRHIFMVDLGTTSTTLDGWSSPLFLQPCYSTIPLYIQAAGWTPDDNEVVIATTGYKGQSPLCDTASMWLSSGTNLSPLWINRTGCDSLYSTVVTSTTVYVGGHERYLNNNACDTAGTTAVSRPGIGAIGLTTGLATSWNPTRSRGHAADDMVLTAQGLWVASDNTQEAYYCAGKWHPGLCMFPYGT
ncbi:MAG: hypothetical protein ACJ74O_15915 [Frankiaceae bacterium]